MDYKKVELIPIKHEKTVCEAQKGYAKLIVDLL